MMYAYVHMYVHVHMYIPPYSLSHYSQLVSGKCIGCVLCTYVCIDLMVCTALSVSVCVCVCSSGLLIDCFVLRIDYHVCVCVCVCVCMFKWCDDQLLCATD